MKYIDIQNKKKEIELVYDEKEKCQLSSQSAHVILCFSKQSVKQSVNQNKQGSWILCSHGGYLLLETLIMNRDDSKW